MTLKPEQVAVAMLEAGVAKHNTRYDQIFFKAVCLEFTPWVQK
jgi:hypothetical protein